jgi:hypothetical protein
MPGCRACGIVTTVKALQSKRAKAVLADPEARDQLRSFLATRTGRPAGHAAVARAELIEVQQAGGKTLRVQPRVVAKAA